MSSGNEQPSVDVGLSDAAIDWVVKLNSGTASEEDLAAFEQWRFQSSEHERAVLEAETIWYGVGVAGDKLRAETRKNITRRALLGGGIVALGGLGLAQYDDINARIVADHITGIGEQRMVTLGDGSTVRLNADSAISIDYQPNRRGITLLKGQAHFTVSSDSGRPFIVDAEGGQTRAIGTAFDVGIGAEDVVVTVSEGRVDVSTGQEASHGVEVGSDEQVRYLNKRSPSRVKSVDAAIETAWRRGKLIFNQRPLSEVVFEIERYLPGKIFVARAHVRALNVTGVFNLSEPDSVLRIVGETLPVRIATLPLLTVIY
ncbi:MAG: FecR family protein [Parvibaculaceae bacterium]|nr:FecR family protein [Parvibaculaceae bacterium]